MRPPLAGKRSAARRLVDGVRRRLAPAQRALPVTLPGVAGEEDEGPVTPGAGAPAPASAPVPASAPASVSAPAEDAPSPEQAAARIDAARDRLRATIEQPDDSAD